jgi:release factor glutamine methyltransferase
MAALSDLRVLLLNQLKQAGIDPAEANLEVQLIIKHATGRSTADQLAYPDWLVPDAAAALAQRIADQRAQRKPLQYLLGEQWFMGLRFGLEEGVLIPRADTETLVQTSLEYLGGLGNPVFVDVGTGSGAIAVSLLKLLPAARGYAIDVSPTACRVALANASDHHVAGRLSVRQIDWLHFHCDEKLDAVISNPPYIAAAQLAELQPEVSVFEPKEALLGSGEDGVGFFSDLSRNAKRFLRAGGLLAVEVGYGQSDAVQRMFKDDGWSRITVRCDLNGVARCICAFHAAETIEK